MKKWNTEGKTETMTEVVDPLIKLAEEILADPRNSKEIDYTGFEHGTMTGGNCADGRMVGSKSYRKQMKKEKKRSPVGLVVELAFQLGMEQGRRFFNLHLNHKQTRTNFLLEKIKTRLENNPDADSIKYLIEDITEELGRT